MRATKKSLQKLTDFQSKADALLSLDQINHKDLATLNRAEMRQFYDLLTKKLNTLKEEERDKFIDKVLPIMPERTKNEIWENNHAQVTWALSTLLKDNGRMPTKTELAIKTGLSRQTIHKHIKEYASNPLYSEQIEQFKFLSSKVLARVYSFAVNGDVAAAKLFFNIIGMNNGKAPNSTLIQNQNNYIQVNRTILSQETVKHLTPEQLDSLESMLRNILPRLEASKAEEGKD